MSLWRGESKMRMAYSLGAPAPVAVLTGLVVAPTAAADDDWGLDVIVDPGPPSGPPGGVPPDFGRPGGIGPR